MEQRHRARGARTGVVGTLLVAAFLFGRRGSEAPAPVDTPAVRDATALLASLDALEAELTVGRAGTEHHAELARRHNDITAVACENAVSHLRASEELARRALNRRREPRPEPAASAPEEPAGAAGHHRDPGLHGIPPPARHDDAFSP